MRATNLTLLTDLYELTMMQGYFKTPTNQTVIFDMFYRVNPCGGSFAITAGLEQSWEKSAKQYKDMYVGLTPRD